MILFTEREKEHTRGMYAELAGSIAEAILDGERVHHERVQAGIESGGATVFVAAYAHRFGTDLSAFASERDAGRALIDIATRQCARDPDIRGSVIERFGRWPAQAMPSRELDQLIEDWGQFDAHACPILGISRSSASSIHRTVVDRLRDALRDNLERDGVRADEIDRELALMQDLLS